MQFRLLLSSTELKKALGLTDTQIVIWDMDHQSTQGQTRPHRSTEESFITPLEEI